MPLSYGSTYSVAVGTQPTGQTCTVSNGSGTVTGVVSSVTVSCTTNTYSIGGSISGLTASGLMLTDNGGNALSLNSGSTSFTFSTQLAYGASYAVAVSAQPTGQTCSVSSGSGTVTATVTSVSVSCATNTYSIGGSITGLTASGLMLTDNGGNALSVTSGSTSFTFSTQLAYGASYAVAVSTQPTGQTCTVSNGSGTVTGTVTSVTLSCVNSYTIGGTISGLNVSSVVLANGSATVTVSAGSSSWVFATAFATGSSYSVTVQTQPLGETCQVTSGGSGTLSGNVNNVTVACAFGLWTWESGSNAGNASGVYGTKGTPAASNVPGARDSGLTWTDSSGNLWLFGGQATSGELNDLWEYSPTTQEWTWVSGGSGFNANGTYGTKGTASASNVPGARLRAVSWIDSSGNLWLFGGNGYGASGGFGSLNDLWEYSPGTGEWTWVSGSNAINANGTYGTKGTASASNVPGARSVASSWIDSSNNLWLFGGVGYGSTGGTGSLNDLWEYSPSTGEWTWVSGSNAINANGTYGTEGTASASNVPGARGGGATWIDASGNLWLFGGSGYPASGSSGQLNDLWKYTPSNGEWTWVNGGTGINAYGVFGTEGIASASNAPGSRWLAASWIDSSGNLWLFGGSGYVASGNGWNDDLWEYSPSTGEWTWVSGSQSASPSGIYGTQGTGSVSSVPGGRQGPVGWIDSSGNLWMFGGYGDAASGSGYLNDLWRFSPG
jgi:N-acetylneuraminic acid mutarotase